MSIYKIHIKSSFIDDLAKGLVARYGNDLADILIIFPNDLSCKFLYLSLANYPKMKLPQIISLIGNDNLSVFNNYKKYLEIPKSFSHHETSFFVLETFLLWQKEPNDYFLAKKMLIANDFCHNFIKLWQKLEENSINYQKFSQDLAKTNFPLVLELEIDFLAFFMPLWQEKCQKQQKTSFSQENNNKLKVKTELIGQINDYKQIILAGFNLFEQNIKDFAQNLLKNPKGIIIEHEDLTKKEQIDPKIKDNYWFLPQKTEKTIIKNFIISKNQNAEAELINNFIKENNSKIIVATSNMTLKKLILFKTKKINQQKNYDIIDFLSFIIEYYDNKNIDIQQKNSQISHKLANFSCKTKEIIELLTEKADIFLISTKLSNLTHEEQLFLKQLQLKSKNNFFQLKKIISFLQKDKDSLFYEDDDLLIIHPKDLRLKNFNAVIMADITEESWQLNHHKIFTNELIKKKYPECSSFLDQENESFFNRQLASKSIIFTKSEYLSGNKKSNEFLPFFQIKNELAKTFIYDDLKNYHNIVFAKKNIIVFASKAEKTHNFSATKIERIFNNPYSLYAEYVLRLKAKNIFSAPNFGNLAHKMLELYIKNQDSDIEKILLQELEKIDNIFLKFVWQERFFHIFTKFKKIINKKTDVLDFLAEYHQDLEILPNTKLTSIMDLVEILADKKVRIIDYKTGTPPSQTDVSSGKNLQMLVSSLILQRKLGFLLEDLEFWHLEGKEHSAIKIKKIKNAQELSELAEKKLVEIIKEYQKPKTPIISFPNEELISRYDNYFHLARFDKI